MKVLCVHWQLHSHFDMRMHHSAVGFMQSKMTEI